MKKIIFSLMALVCSMSMNAQVMKVMKGETVVETYPVAQADNVIFEEGAPAGTATRKGNIEVKWVQLWANGPLFAEYNVGAEYNRAWNYGGYYTWGGNKDQNSPYGDNCSSYYTGTGDLAGDNDTATKLWGSKWRMPTKEEFEALLTNCVVKKETNYKGTGVDGYTITGKGDFASNSLFFPTSGYYSYSRLGSQYRVCPGTSYYSSSTSVGNNGGDNGSYWLNLDTKTVAAHNNLTSDGLNSRMSIPVRAVLNICGTATRTGGIVKWVQLWENGPKFAEYNVGAENDMASDYGGYYTWGGSIDQDENFAYNTGHVSLTGNDDTATNRWGDNWRMPTKEEFEALIDKNNCDVVYEENYKETGVKGFLFTGKGVYASNSLFFPISGYFMYDKNKKEIVLYQKGTSQYYQSSTADGSGSYYLYMSYSARTNVAAYVKSYNLMNSGRPVRAVLAE